MNNNGESINKTLSLVFEDPFYWAVILILRNGQRTGMTMADIKKSLVESGAIKSLDQAWIFTKPALEKLKNDGLVENQINEKDKFKLTCNGRKTAKKASELIDFLNCSKQKAK